MSEQNARRSIAERRTAHETAFLKKDIKFNFRICCISLMQVFHGPIRYGYGTDLKSNQACCNIATLQRCQIQPKYPVDLELDDRGHSFELDCIKLLLQNIIQSHRRLISEMKYWQKLGGNIFTETCGSLNFFPFFFLDFSLSQWASSSLTDWHQFRNTNSREVELIWLQQCLGVGASWIS